MCGGKHGLIHSTVHSLLFIREVDVGAELYVFERAFPAPHRTDTE